MNRYQSTATRSPAPIISALRCGCYIRGIYYLYNANQHSCKVNSLLKKAILEPLSAARLLCKPVHSQHSAFDISPFSRPLQQPTTPRNHGQTNNRSEPGLPVASSLRSPAHLAVPAHSITEILPQHADGAATCLAQSARPPAGRNTG